MTTDPTKKAGPREEPASSHISYPISHHLTSQYPTSHIHRGFFQPSDRSRFNPLHRRLHLRGRHVPHMLGEVPLVAFRVYRAVPSVSIKCVRRFLKDPGSSFFGTCEVPVHIVHVYVEDLGDGAELLRILVLRSGTSQHEHAVICELHSGVLNCTVGSFE